ncbi:MAG: helix-turn-helix transcriptional regulator [Ardenticatenaceae bacterium]|nr:helix-turn-helix transcriptional regulator [Ardenticatenaceae bacterium]MCB9444849.1 helix-turn-helix transcriptional regulator [Ardenticatenaceae bacterium]
MKAGSKYEALFAHLSASGFQEIRLTFSEIETLLGRELPATARRQRGWWSNRSSGGVQAAAWMGAGYHVTELDLAAEQVTFAKPTLVYTAVKQGDTVLWNSELVKGLRQHLGLSQGELADELGVRQQTVSEWERGEYEPSQATSKYLSLVAERAGFAYSVDSES